MQGTSGAALSLVVLFILPSPLSAKGDIVKVTMQGVDLASPLEIHPNIGEFNVWAGPGTSDGVQTGRFNPFLIEWSQGVVAPPPAGLPRYEVSFHSGCRAGGGDRTCESRLVYVVSYVYDPEAGQGFVYLPGKNDAWYRLNTSSIFRGGLEGNWFRATDDWVRFAMRRMAEARAKAPARRE